MGRNIKPIDTDSKFGQFNQELRDFEQQVLESLPDIVWCIEHPFKEAVWFAEDDQEIAWCARCYWNMNHTVRLKGRIRMLHRTTIKRRLYAFRLEESLMNRLKMFAEEQEVKPTAVLRKWLDEKLIEAEAEDKRRRARMKGD